MDLLRELAVALAEKQQSQGNSFLYGRKHTAPGSPISIGYSHGPGGLLTFPGVDNTVFHTIMGNTSIIGTLPTMPSVETNPTFLTLTGVGDDTGDEPDEPCDDAPVGGLLTGCMLTSVFGRYERQTPELDIRRLGQRIDRSDPLDLALVGSPIASAGLFNTGPQDARAPSDVLTNEVSRKFWERNISLWRLLSRQLWTGNPQNNLGSSGGYKELTGFNLLINTGHVDIQTAAACPEMDSHISSFGYQSIDGENSDIVAHFTNVWHQLNHRARGMGLNPVRWVVAMKPEMFWQLTSIWPCSYYTYRCLTSPGMESPASLNMDAVQMRNLVDQMRDGQYLLVDGDRLDVVLDDGIPELSGNDSGGNFPAGCFSSDIYFIPMSVVGGRSVTYMEYFDYSNPSAQSAITNMGLYRAEGAFLTWPKQKNTCIQWQTCVEPRLIMRTPWLAARIQNVVYCPTEHVREPFPNDPYYVGGGGELSREGPSYSTLWS